MQQRPRAIPHTIPFETSAPARREGVERLNAAARIEPVPILGRVIGGRYTIERQVGEGPTGIVYRARQAALERPVAVKILHAQNAAQQGSVERFHRAASASSQLDHPNAAQILDYGHEPDGLLYLVTEYVEGRDLATLLADERVLQPRRAVAIVRQILAALAVAHDRRIVHRNLKPQNVMLCTGVSDDGEPIDVVKVTDFGLFAGTPEYTPPELSRGAVVDARSDLYSVGVLLYELLTGEKPFCGESPVAIAMQHAAEPVFPPSQLADIPPGLEAVCLRALQKSPHDRFASARQMRAALADALGVAATERPPAPGPAPIAEPPRRRWPLYALAAASAAAVAVLALHQGQSRACSLGDALSGARVEAKAEPPQVAKKTKLTSMPEGQ